MSITQFNNRFGSVYAHMIAISHYPRNSVTLNKYDYFLKAVQTYSPSQPNGIWNSICPAIDYVSEVTRQIPVNFVEEAKRIALVTGFRRSPPQNENGYYCSHLRGTPQGERTCYPTLLNWMNPGIVETRKTVACETSCLQVSETDLPPYDGNGFYNGIALSIDPSASNLFPSVVQPYGFTVADKFVLSADMAGIRIPASEEAVAVGVELEYKSNSDSACKIEGVTWCSVNFLNGNAAFADSGNGVWKKSYSGLTASNNGEYVVRAKAANETGGAFFHSQPMRIIVQNGVLACFGMDTQKQGVSDLLCGEPYCDPFCAGGSKEIVTNAGPDFDHPESWWLNDSAVEQVPAAGVEGIGKYDGMPYAYFRQKGVLKNGFSLSSPLMAWNWNIGDVANYGYAIEGGNTCEQGTGFYELKASSPDGRSDNWVLGVQLKKLPLSGYLLNSEPSDSPQLRNGYVNDVPPDAQKNGVLAKGWGCSIGTDPGYSDVKDLCNSKNLEITKHTHFGGRNPQSLDCFIPCSFGNCGYCINLKTPPAPQFDWQKCTPAGQRDRFTDFAALIQASYNPPQDALWALGAGREVGGCPNEATRISD